MNKVSIKLSIQQSEIKSVNNSQVPAMKEIWLQKYRPTKLDEVYGNDEITDTLKSLVSQGNIPHLILTGPPGVGKTSSLLCVAKELLGDKLGEAYKELNASDERGIDVVRDQIKMFARKKVTLPPGITKLILLDEADSLTDGAMHALRMIMSNQAETTRFVLSCNNDGKIIEAIQSRCIVLRFSKLRDTDIEKCLRRIIENQTVQITEKAFETMLFIADGDMRTAINNLQACHYASQGGKIQNELVLHICDCPNIEEIKAIIILTHQKRVKEAVTRMHAVYGQGHSIFDIVQVVYKVLMACEEEIPREKLLEMLMNIALLKQRVVEGLTSEIQLANFLARCAAL